jgi:acetyltransferase
MAADACEDYGLELAPPPRRLAEELENPHIAWHRLHNPVDIWPLGMVGGSFTRVFKNAARILLESDRVDAVLGIAPALSSPFHEDLDMAVTIREVLAANSEQKPVALWLYGDGLVQKMQELTDEPGVACFAGIDEAVMGLAGMYRYHKLQQQAMGLHGEAVEGPPRESQRTISLPVGELLVGESALALLNDYQIPVADWSIAKSAENAAQRAKEMGYPVVLKIVSPQWLHKSDWGGVRLNVRNDMELKAAYGELLGQFQQRTPDGLLTGILVQKQMQGVELLMGIKRDPQFGPVLVAGMGGIYTEIFKDLARSLAPLSRADAEAMLQSLRIHPILTGLRGQQPVHLPALIEALMALSRLALDYPEISELDLNPVMATADGCWCVDCRVVT